MIRVCPERDAVCPHGNDCPYSIDRYECKDNMPPPVNHQNNPLSQILADALEKAAALNGEQ